VTLAWQEQLGTIGIPAFDVHLMERY